MKHTPKILLLLFLAATMLPLSSVGAQAPSAVEMIVTPAFEGIFKYGEWLPLSIELTNTGQDLEAEVRVRVPRPTGGVTFTQPVSLPAGAHKLVTLYILPNNYSHSLDVELVSAGEVIATKKAAMKPMMNVNVVIGLLAAERGALSLLNGVQYPNNNRPVQVVDVDLWQLPEHMEALRSFDVLIFNNVDTSKLTPEQAAALTAWVQSGGRLVLGGGAGAELTFSGLPADLLPVKLDGKRNLPAEDLQGLAAFAGGQKIQTAGEFVVSQALPAEGVETEVLTGEEGSALITERSMGRGQIDFIALDLSAAPFEGWSSSQRFWEKLLRASEDFFNQPTDISQRSMRASMMTNPLTMIPSMELPSVKWLALILGIYILIVGPINYLILKRKNRLHWAWITIPGITLLFSGAAFGSGYLMKGSDLLIHKIGVLEIQPGGSALATSYMGLFSPSQKSYQVEVPGGSLLSPMLDDGMYYSGMGVPTGGSEMTIQQGKPSMLKGLSVDQWSMQSFMTEQSIPDYGRITGELEMVEGRLMGKLRNGLKTTVKDVTLIVRNQYLRLGDLAAGEEVPVDLDPTPNLTMRGMPVYYMMYEEEAANPDLSNSERALIDLKRSILSPLFDNQLMFKLSSSMGGSAAGGMTLTSGQSVVVLGWVDELPPEIEVDGETAAVQSMGLVFDTINYVIPRDGKIVIPPGLLSGHLFDSNAGMCGPMDSVSFYLERGIEAKVEYQLPDPLYYEFSQIDLRLEADMPVNNSLPITSVYDWQAEKWVKFPNVAIGTNTIENPARFIGSKGEVHVQFAYNEKSQMGGCIYMEMGFEGEGKGGRQ